MRVKRCDSHLMLLAAACFFGSLSILLSAVGCSSPYGKLIPAKEMAIYNAESRIRLLKHYDPEYNKEEIKKLEATIAGLKAAIKKEKEEKELERIGNGKK